MSKKRFRANFDVSIYDSEKEEYISASENGLKEIAKRMNEQQDTIEMYQRRVHKREEQISIIKKHCLKFLTDEQFEIIRKELENG